MDFKHQVNVYGEKIIEWARDGREIGPTSDWPMAEFSSAVSVVAVYLSFILFGAFFMQKAGSLDKFTYSLRFVYNLSQVMLCSYMCIEAGLIAYRNNYTVLPCVPFQAHDPPVGNLLWLFYISKILDFADTVFIVLGKKWNQLSFLHVYHHTTIFLFYWLNLNVAFDGDVYLTILLNGFIHTVMYTYYFVSMHTKDIWWKSSLTILQMVQFVAMICQALYLLTSSCRSFPPRVTQTYAAYIFSLLLLFGNFFIKSYVKKSPRKSGKSKRH